MTTPAEQHSFSEYEAIVAALDPYMTVATTGDVEGVRKTWHDHARIVGARDGQSINLSLEEFCQRIASMGQAQDLQGRIVSVDIAGIAAVARLEFINWHGFRYTDFLLLSKQDGVWKVSAKVFHAHSRSEVMAEAAE